MYANKTSQAWDILDTVWSDLLSRGGFDGWWDDIDYETRAEIRDSLVERIIPYL